MNDDRHDRIKERAHHLWEQAGRPEGQHDDHWDQAEREVDRVTTAEGKPGDQPPTAGDAAVVATEKRKPKKV